MEHTNDCFDTKHDQAVEKLERKIAGLEAMLIDQQMIIAKMKRLYATWIFIVGASILTGITSIAFLVALFLSNLF